MKSPDASHPDRAHYWLSSFLRQRGLSRQDGRPLYRYRMKDDEYGQAKELLHQLARQGWLAHPDRHIRALDIGALFVAYCAEWFRRESDTTRLKWDDLAPEVFPSVAYPSKQQLTTLGLSYWNRKLRKSGQTNEFLLTVALEGGFPVRILAEGARGWLKEYLRTIMRRAIAWRANTTDEILEIAAEERGRMRKSYQHDDFISLCSELVESLLRLRHAAEAKAIDGVRNSALLDVQRPGWREELPIYVPEDEELVAELLVGLLDEKLTGLATSGVETRRFLVKRNGMWRPAIQVLADGEVSTGKLPELSGMSRVHAIAAGELGSYLSGEVALLEPPAGDQRRWRVRPYARITKLFVDYPFAAAVNVTMTSPDSLPLLWTWPRGDALRSDLLVFEMDENSTPQEPLLRFIRSGSVSSPAKILYVLVPQDWAIEPAIAGTSLQVEEISGLQRKLARISSATYFKAPENESARFRVEPDTESRENKLELGHLVTRGFFLEDNTAELVKVPLQVLIHEKGKEPRLPTTNELSIRRPGGGWRPLSGPIKAVGALELSWRDPIANIQIEKHRLVLMPEGAGIIGTMTSAEAGEICLQELPGWTISSREKSCLIGLMNDSTLTVRFTGRPVYKLPLTLCPPAGPAFHIVVPLVGRDAVVALANGTIVRPGQQVDIGMLRGAVAVSPRKTILHLCAKGSKSGGINAAIDGEFPLGILRSAIDEILATIRDQDGLIELSFIGDSRPPIRVSRYRHDQLACEGEMVRWIAPQSSNEVAPTARMILKPVDEHPLEYQGNGLWQLAEQCKGLCLVYLRDGVDVVSRPTLIQRAGISTTYNGALVWALALSDYNERQRSINFALAQLGTGEGNVDDLKWLHDLVTNLNGLPASAFDTLKLLPNSAEALIRLLICARDAGERAAIWSLQKELPFLWLALPLKSWAASMEREWTALVGSLESALGKANAMKMAMDWLSGVGDSLVALEPALEVIFSMINLPKTSDGEGPSLKDLTNGYIRNQLHHGGEEPNNIATDLSVVGLKLPLEIAEKSHADFAGLFAPVLLATSAHRKFKLTTEHALVVRRTVREDPLYVSAAWGHLMKFYGKG